MSGRNAIAWDLAAVLLLALVLTVEWWRAGELENLNRRVDELELTRRRRTTNKPSTAKQSEVKP